MRVQIVDPSAYTRPYDHALCSALGRLGVDVELITSRFVHGDLPAPDGYRVRELFYGRAFGAPGSAIRSLSKLAAHPAGMARLRHVAREADLVHFQWLPVQWLDLHMLPRVPIVLTAHDLLPREARLGQARAQRRLYDAVDAVIVHSENGRRTLTGLGVDVAKVHVIHHGAFEHLTVGSADPLRLPAELTPHEGPVVLFFGLLRPYKGVEVLLEAWRQLECSGAADHGELWIVGQPRMPLEPLLREAGPTVRFVARFVSEDELRALFGRADVVVLPYARTERLDHSGVLATALAFGNAIVVTEVGSFPEVAAEGGAWLVPPGDPAELAEALRVLVADPDARERLGHRARAAARRSYSWHESAVSTLRVYEQVIGVSRESLGDPPQSRPR
ncbi:MAG TPA: glycosyltransferase family 4 protein [Solirubrobacteraceae bacterium]|nr:glycosyltransferase family 4 protein [Solirubrobacteraceae bacterium]